VTGFALGNLVPAALLGLGCGALPIRWWPADVLLLGTVATLCVTSGLVLTRRGKPRFWLGIGARVLLGMGLVIIAAAALAVAFLAGIHGDFGRGGMSLMGLVAFMVLPYTVVYPVLQLAWLGTPVGRERGPAPTAESAGGPS
jgi:hypothetical protein